MKTGHRLARPSEHEEEVRWKAEAQVKILNEAISMYSGVDP